MIKACSAILRLAAAPLVLAALMTGPVTPAMAQQQPAAVADDDTASQADDEAAPLTEDELEVLVARIALYPDELVAVICAASVYPLQIVEAARYLDAYKKDNTLKPSDKWDGSIISLLNYPEIAKMMSDDLQWTQALGDALAYQQKDVLIAIQQLREEAVAKGIIKTDDKMEVSNDNDNIVITPVSKETVYVPQYEPQMLYEPSYAPAPVTYYPTAYPSYYLPTATFFAAAVTGAVWASVVDWNDWGVWGGRWGGNDIDIDCNHCFNNRDFNGKVNFNDIDWKNVDRSKLKFDKNQLNKVDRKNIQNNLTRNKGNSIGDRAASIKKDRPSRATGQLGNGKRDIRKSTLDGLKADRGNLGKGGKPDRAKPNLQKPGDKKPNLQKPAGKKPSANRTKNAGAKRTPGKVKPGGKIDKRPSKPSGLGSVGGGKRQSIESRRGSKSMGGGNRGGGHRVGNRGGGRRR